MNSSPSPYLKVTRSQSSLARDEDDLLVLDVDALDRADALQGSRRPRARRTAPSCRSRARAPRRAADSGTPRSSSRSRRSARMRSPRPRGSRRHARRSRRWTRRAHRRHSAQRRQRAQARHRYRRARGGPRRATVSCSANCRSPSFTPGRSYGRCGSGSDSVIAMSRYVQRVLEGRGEDLRIEARVGRIEDDVRLRRPNARDDRLDRRGIHRDSGEPAVVEAGRHRFGTLGDEVCERDVIEERPALGDRSECRPDAPGSDDEDVHAGISA